MSKSKYFVCEIFFYIFFVLFSVIIGVLIFLLGSYPSYILLAVAAALILSARKTVYWRSGVTKLVCWLLALVLCFGGLAQFRPDKNVSFEGALARESIRMITNMPKRNSEDKIEWESLLSKISIWRTPRGYTLSKHDIDGLPAELLDSDKKSGRIILQLHGGAYTIGYSDIYRQNALRYSRASGGASVLSIDYRTAPAYTYPAALEDALKAWEWLLSQGYNESDIVVAGDSAGGNLALALVMTLRDGDRALPRALILMSPWTDMAGTGESRAANQNLDPIFGGKDGIVNNFSGDRNSYAAGYELDDPRLSPAYGDFSGLPPMLIQVGTHEIMESDSVIVGEKAAAADVPVILTKYEGMFHVFQLSGQILKESRAAWKEVAGFLEAQFRAP